MTDIPKDVRTALDAYGHAYHCRWHTDVSSKARADEDDKAEADTATALIAAVVSAYQASLVAQTDAETMGKAVEAAGSVSLPDRDCGCYTEDGFATCEQCRKADFLKGLEAAAPILVAKERAKLESAYVERDKYATEAYDAGAKLAEAEKDRTIAWARHDNAVKQLASVRRETLEEIQAMVDKIHTRRAGDLNHEWSEYKDGAYDAAGEILDEITRVADAATRAGGDQ